MKSTYKGIIITGPTAGGKTKLAVQVAHALGGEVISADSRQVYRGMDLGTGKDLAEYQFKGQTVPYHLIDIREPGYHYNVFEFNRDCKKFIRELSQKEVPILIAGGTGMYIQSILDNYRMIEVPVNEAVRQERANWSHEALQAYLISLKKQHNQSDLDTPQRTIRAIEIAEYYRDNPELTPDPWDFKALIFALHFERSEQRRRITARLDERLKQGMIEEVKSLLDQGLKEEELLFYGLEYKYLTLYVLGKISFDEMRSQLNTAIHQFAKRQMTYLRKLEKDGHPIHWLKGEDDWNETIHRVLEKSKDFLSYD